MKLDLSLKIVNLAGTSIPWGEDTKDGNGKVTTPAPPMTLGDVLLNTAICKPAEGKHYTKKQQRQRWHLAKRIWKIKTEVEPPVGEVPVTELRVIEDDIARCWSTMIAGQTFDFIDEAHGGPI